MSKASSILKIEGRLTLGDALRMLVNDSMIDKASAEKLYNDRKMDSSKMHPLVVIGEQKWKVLKDPTKVLTVEALSKWLAEKAGGRSFSY